MSDIQNTDEIQKEMATRFVRSILGIILFKMALIYGLNRWARSLR